MKVWLTGPSSIEIADDWVNPCPFCGKKDKLWLGVTSSTYRGVQCERCHVTLTLCYPNRWPSGVKSDADGEMWLFRKALAIWNRRRP